MYHFYLNVGILTQLIFCTMLVSTQTLEEIKLTQEMMFEDISAIKKKVWVDITSKLNNLAKKLENVDTNGVTMPTTAKNNNNTTMDLLDTSMEEMLKVCIDDRYSRLLKSFKDEKMKSRKLEEIVTHSLNEINDIKTSLDVYHSALQNQSTQMFTLERDLIKVKDNFDNTRKTMSTLQQSYERSERDLKTLNETFYSQQEESARTMSKPSFVSDWVLIRAQDPEFSEKTIPHGLGTLPYKVEVQIRPTSGPNAGWIFTGDSAIQSDDDAVETYGGVLYFYDEKNVYLLAPKKGNGRDVGVIINTGANSQKRLGNNHQTSVEAYVRVKVWASFDFPKLDMMSEWLPLDIRNKSLTYYDVKHGLNEYPGFVNVQIRCKNTQGNYMISEGIGASMMHATYSNAGGVVHAFNDNSVRIWTGYIRNMTEEGNSFYRLFGTRDGWAGSTLSHLKLDVNKGEFRVLTWKQHNIISSNSESEKHEDNIEFSEWTTFKDLSPDVDLFSVHVQANDGLNKGFRFPAYGNSQSQVSPYGGVVVAYNSFGDVRLWRPNPSKGGYLVNIHEPYGNGVNVQSTNNAHYVCNILRCRN
ncbi:hypothetical protein ACF0H5_018038 [Mactra antiquata]